MNKILNAFIKVAESEGIKITQLESKIGASKGVLSRAINNNSDVQSKWLMSLVENYPNYNLDWLLMDKGNKYADEKSKVNEPNVPYSISNLGVPYYDIDFTAGFLEIENNQQTKPDHYVTHPFFQGCDYIVRASGQSMAKIIKHGDAIGLVEIKNWNEFIPLGEIYAIVTKNHFRMIKIITKGEDKSSFTLISKPMDGKKEEFPPQQIKKEQILSIFRVQASSHLF